MATSVLTPLKNKNHEVPQVVRFKARLIVDDAAAYVTIPKAASDRLRGMENLEGTINGHPFRAPLPASATGAQRLRVNIAMRRGASARDGDTVQFAVLGPEPSPKPPADLRAAFDACPEAKALWGDLTIMARRDWVRWILGAKTAQTRARRVKRTVEQLAQGKRRPCCVNFYEFMLERVRASE